MRRIGQCLFRLFLPQFAHHVPGLLNQHTYRASTRQLASPRCVATGAFRRPFSRQVPCAVCSLLFEQQCQLTPMFPLAAQPLLLGRALAGYSDSGVNSPVQHAWQQCSRTPAVAFAATVGGTYMRRRQLQDSVL